MADFNSIIFDVIFYLYQIWQTCWISVQSVQRYEEVLGVGHFQKKTRNTAVFCPGFQKGRVPSEKGTLVR